jgi:hypothetical protein
METTELGRRLLSTNAVDAAMKRMDGKKLFLLTGKTYRDGVTLHSVGAGKYATADNKIATWRNSAQIRNYLERNYPHKFACNRNAIGDNTLTEHYNVAFLALKERFGDPLSSPLPEGVSLLRSMCKHKCGVLPLDGDAKWAVSFDEYTFTLNLYFANETDAVHAKLLAG